LSHTGPTDKELAQAALIFSVEERQGPSPPMEGADSEPAGPAGRDLPELPGLPGLRTRTPRAAGRRKMLLGAALVFGGMLAAGAGPGSGAGATLGVLLILGAWAAVIFGVIQFLRGLGQVIRG
jgi:hypothetical protein